MAKPVETSNTRPVSRVEGMGEVEAAVTVEEGDGEGTANKDKVMVGNRVMVDSSRDKGTAVKVRTGSADGVGVEGTTEADINNDKKHHTKRSISDMGR